jgi:hypothetical protein
MQRKSAEQGDEEYGNMKSPEITVAGYRCIHDPHPLPLRLFHSTNFMER